MRRPEGLGLDRHNMACYSVKKGWSLPKQPTEFTPMSYNRV